jgi:hypothetical protein
MGYWGYLVAAKSNQPLDKLPELSAFGDEYVNLEPLRNGWQQAWVAGADDDPLTGVSALAKATGNPVIGAFILDSDCGPVAAATPSGATWTATLAKATAIDSYEMPDDGVTASAAATSLNLWAEAASLGSDQELMHQALDPDAVGPEHLFKLLLKATGIAPTQ